jgi:hypothetical protein
MNENSVATDSTKFQRKQTALAHSLPRNLKFVINTLLSH